MYHACSPFKATVGASFIAQPEIRSFQGHHCTGPIVGFLETIIVPNRHGVWAWWVPSDTVLINTG